MKPTVPIRPIVVPTTTVHIVTAYMRIGVGAVARS